MLCCLKSDKGQQRQVPKKRGLDYELSENAPVTEKGARSSKIVPDHSLIYQHIVGEQIIDHECNRINEKYQFPASFRKAKIHLRANKFGYNAGINSNKNDEDEPGHSAIYTADSRGQTQGRPKLCPCCSQPINTVNISLSSPTTNPKDKEFLLNTSATLFFSFIKMAICYSIIMFLVCGLFNLLTSLDGNYCVKNPKICTKSVFQLISTYNKHMDPKERVMLQIQNILCLVSVILSIIFFTYYKKMRSEIYDIIDDKNQTQDDYTIFVENIPILDFPDSNDADAKEMNQIDFNYENNLKEIFDDQIFQWIKWMEQSSNNDGVIQHSLKQLMEPNNGISKLKTQNKVTSISLCFDLSQVRKINEQRQILMQKHLNAHQKDQGVSFDKDKNKEIKNQIQALNDIELSLCERFARDDSPTFNITHFVGKAFISFEYQHYREYIMQKYEERKKFMYGDTELVLSRASHPTDIEWLNMDVTDSERFKKVTIAYVIIMMILVFSAAALIGIDFLKLKGMKEGSDISQESKIANYSLTIFGSIVTSIINNGIWQIIVALSGYERHQTATNKIASQIVKTIIAQFINTVLILYLIQVFNQRPYLSSAGLVVQASTYIVVSGFISIAVNAINIPLWVRYGMLWWKYSYYTKSGMEQRREIATYQVKFNKDYELPAFDITGRYIWYLLQIYTCMFYFYLVPVGVLATAVIFGIQFWIDKVKLFKLSSEYKELGFFLSKVIFKVFESSLLIFTIGNLIFQTVIYGENRIDPINLISLGIAFVYTCIIVFAPPSFERKIFSSFETFEKTSYSECLKQHKFAETYWTQNPATMFAKEQNINDMKSFISQGVAEVYFNENDILNEQGDDPDDWIVEDKINNL